MKAPPSNTVIPNDVSLVLFDNYPDLTVIDDSNDDYCYNTNTVVSYAPYLQFEFIQDVTIGTVIIVNAESASYVTTLKEA